MDPDPHLDVHVDPYPDLDVEGGTGHDVRAELSEDDSRLLAALSRPQPAVVTAVEEQDQGVRADRVSGTATTTRPRGRRAPVFQEPTA